MGAKANLANEPTKIVTGIDSVVIRQYNGGIAGGRTLDMTDFKEDVIKAGHLVIRTLDEDNVNYVYKPMPVDGGAYKALPEKHEYVGVVVCSKPANEPLVGVMDDGRVNDKAMPYPITEEMRKAIKTAIPTLIFEHD
ncbi:hypothetical protein [Prevotella sp. KH2C16]|uniref:hypothetical protein n=1 Tax=Prevotella sp. KH2C16 TaxID=1855325 RepID=UPI0008E11789|nr:hypothetical protein [Prevotella sp. KH2C16]SFG56833.1 hypothetical protein SAMN05216383_12071 [Prevotella sp. KH2C16]